LTRPCPTVHIVQATAPSYSPSLPSQSTLCSRPVLPTSPQPIDRRPNRVNASASLYHRPADTQSPARSPSAYAAYPPLRSEQLAAARPFPLTASVLAATHVCHHAISTLLRTRERVLERRLERMPTEGSVFRRPTQLCEKNAALQVGTYMTELACDCTSRTASLACQRVLWHRASDGESQHRSARYTQQSDLLAWCSPGAPAPLHNLTSMHTHKTEQRTITEKSVAIPHC
jgi:hypothetical protein